MGIYNKYSSFFVYQYYYIIDCSVLLCNAIFPYVDPTLFFFLLIRFDCLKKELNFLAITGFSIIFAPTSLDSFGQGELRSSMFPTFVLGYLLLRIIYKLHL